MTHLAHPIVWSLAFCVFALCVVAGVLWFMTEGKTERYVGKPIAKIRDSVFFGAQIPLWILYAILVNVAAALPWNGPSRMLAKLK